MTQFILRNYRRTINSIAFYPTIMGILSVAFALFIISFEYSETSESIKKAIEQALVKNPESARLILGTIVGGIISLMVFSFTMVMVVLNMATATLSPRVVPGLVAKKFHQIVLGFYIATIIFSLLLLVNINSGDNGGIHVPSLGIFLAMLLAIGSLGLFVYFIHSISIAIQVDNILNSILKSSLSNLQIKIRKSEGTDHNRIKGHNWHEIKADKAGFLKQVDSKRLIKFLKDEDVILKVNTHRGFFILSGYPFVSINKEINQEDKIKCITDEIEFYNEEYVNDHYTYGFKQITEIAVKALSPGINDPATAIKSIDMLNLLFIERLKLSPYEIKKDDEGKVRIIYGELSFEQLLYNTIGPIREYGKNDPQVIIKLLSLLKNILYTDTEKHYAKVLFEEALGVLQDAKEGNRNFIDKKAINDAIDSFNKISDEKLMPL